MSLAQNRRTEKKKPPNEFVAQVNLEKIDNLPIRIPGKTNGNPNETHKGWKLTQKCQIGDTLFAHRFQLAYFRILIICSRRFAGASTSGKVDVNATQGCAKIHHPA
jgi:hypothetical protein